MSAWVLGLLPFGTAAMMMLMNPEFLRVLWEDSVGLRMIGVTLVSMVLGMLWMRRIIRIHV